MGLYYVDELATDLWASLDAAMDRATDPATVACTVNPDTARVFRVGDFVVFNDEAQNPDVGICAPTSARRSSGPAATAMWSRPATSSSSGRIRASSGQATFGTLRCAHSAGIRFFKLDIEDVHVRVKKGFFRTPGLPARVEAKIPSVCVVAALVGVANNFGYGPFTVFPLAPPQRAVHARRPDVQRRRVHVPDPRRARGRGQRRRSRCACRTPLRSGASMRTSRRRPRTARARTS